MVVLTVTLLFMLEIIFRLKIWLTESFLAFILVVVVVSFLGSESAFLGDFLGGFVSRRYHN